MEYTDEDILEQPPLVTDLSPAKGHIVTQTVIRYLASIGIICMVTSNSSRGIVLWTSTDLLTHKFPLMIPSLWKVVTRWRPCDEEVAKHQNVNNIYRCE